MNDEIDMVKSKLGNHRLNAEINERKHIEALRNVNALKEPIYLTWEEMGNIFDENDEDEKVPICPSCGEMPYSFNQCVFCGQRFIQTNSGRE